MKIIIKIIILSSLILSQTSQQINQAKAYIKNTGMTEKEVRSEAKKRGYSDKQLDEIIEKNKDVKEDILSTDLNNLKTTIDKKSNETVEYNLEESQEIDLKTEKVFNDLNSKKLNFFGYDIFKMDPNLFQSSSVGAVDPNYLIGPGDEIIVMLWGETQFRQVLAVDREGFIFVPEIGQVFVNGLSLTLLESKLFRVFSQSYASLNPAIENPSTFLDISLGNLRPLRIQVLGEVPQPGSYTVSPSATLFSSLYYFNGPTNFGSLRDIRLIRGGENLASIDFYDYLLTGKSPKDQKLQLDDVIFIPPRSKTISIRGEINREGIYELKSDEDLTDLINIAGGLKISAYLNRAQIDRIVPFDQREILGMDRMYTDVNLGVLLNQNVKFSLQDGDKIIIFSVLDFRQNAVDITGAVTRPGKYDLGDSLKIEELIDKAGGLLGDAYKKRADLTRIKPDFTEKLLKINLENISDLNLYLKGMDRLKIYGKSEMVDVKYASIQGHVQRPGRYIIKENMTAFDLIFMAGGYVDPAFKKRAYLERADLLRLNDDQITRSIFKFNLEKILNPKNTSENFLIQAGDMIKIYQKDLFVKRERIRINGIISNPGEYEYKENMVLGDLIFESGGITTSQSKYKVEVSRLEIQDNSIDKYSTLETFYVDNKGITLDISLNNMMSKNISENGYYILKPNDIVSIRADPLLKNQKIIIISGEVYYPGEYSILSPNERLTDIIDRAGGLLPNAYPDASIFSRRGIPVSIGLSEILKKPKSKLNFYVQDGDNLLVVEKPNIVSITGAVNKTGTFKFVPNENLNFYIKLSGGFKQNADKSNIWVEYPNGNSKVRKRFSLFNVKITDGSIIKIGEKEDREPLDKTEFAKEVTSIVANFAQVVAILFLSKTN